MSHVFALVAGMSISVEGFAFTPRPLSPFPCGSLERARRVSRLPVPGRNPVLMRSSVGLLFAENPVARLRKMPRHGDDGATVPALGKQPLIQAADVRLPRGLEPHGAVRGFDKGPFQILVDETRDAADAGVTSAGKHPRYKSRVTGQIFSAR